MILLSTGGTVPAKSTNVVPMHQRRASSLGLMELRGRITFAAVRGLPAMQQVSPTLSSARQPLQRLFGLIGVPASQEEMISQSKDRCLSLILCEHHIRHALQERRVEATWR